MSKVIRNFDLPESYWWLDPAYIVESIAEKYATSVDHMWLVEWEENEAYGNTHIIVLRAMFHDSTTLRISRHFVTDAYDGILDEIIREHMAKCLPSDALVLP